MKDEIYGELARLAEEASFPLMRELLGLAAQEPEPESWTMQELLYRETHVLQILTGENGKLFALAIDINWYLPRDRHPPISESELSGLGGLDLVTPVFGASDIVLPGRVQNLVWFAIVSGEKSICKVWSAGGLFSDVGRELAAYQQISRVAATSEESLNRLGRADHAVRGAPARDRRRLGRRQDGQRGD